MESDVTFKKALKYYLLNSGCIAYEKYDGSLAIATVDKSESIRTITDSDCKLKNNIPDVSFSYTDIDKCYSSICVRYKKVIADEERYGSKKYCKNINFSNIESNISNIHNFTLLDINGNWKYYSTLLQIARDNIGFDRTLTFDADGIRDDDTAERLCRLLILLHYKPLAKIIINGSYSLLNIEIGDKIDTNICTLENYGLNDKIYICSSSRIVPNIKQEANVRIELTELASANLPTTETWIDTYSSGINQVDSFSSGNNYSEAL